MQERLSWIYLQTTGHRFYSRKNRKRGVKHGRLRDFPGEQITLLVLGCTQEEEELLIIKQLILFRGAVLRLAHTIPLAGHLGRTRQLVPFYSVSTGP